MPIPSDTPSIDVVVEYLADKTMTYRGKGKVSGGFIAGDRMEVTAGGIEGPLVTLTIRSLMHLPDLICDFVLEGPEADEVEAQEDFERRIRTRQDIAAAFEAAATRLRTTDKNAGSSVSTP